MTLAMLLNVGLFLIGVGIIVWTLRTGDRQVRESLTMRTWNAETGKVTEDEMRQALETVLRHAIFNANGATIQHSNKATKVNGQPIPINVYVVIGADDIKAYASGYLDTATLAASYVNDANDTELGMRG